MTTKTFLWTEQCNTVLVYQTKYRSQSTQATYWLTFVSFVSVDFDFYSDIRIFFPRIYGGKNLVADSSSRIFFGWYSADKNSVATSDIRRRRLVGLVCTS